MEDRPRRRPVDAGPGAGARTIPITLSITPARGAVAGPVVSSVVNAANNAGQTAVPLLSEGLLIADSDEELIGRQVLRGRRQPQGVWPPKRRYALLEPASR